MSGRSSNAAEWSTKLELPQRAEGLVPRPDDPRLGEIIDLWRGDVSALRPGRVVLLGFPQDEGVRRNHGRPGAAEAPNQLRHWLARLTPWDGEHDVDLTASPPLDLGNVRIVGDLEKSQSDLGEIVAAILEQEAVPLVLGGGHETAFGHYLGHAMHGRRIGIISIDAHLDVRPFEPGRGHSGSPFRQALEHPSHPLRGSDYACLGAQPFAVSREHLRYVRERGGVIHWANEIAGRLVEVFTAEVERLAAVGCRIYVTIDADAVRMADVPGVSAPNPAGLEGNAVLACARRAGELPQVCSLDVVEINPRLDRDGQSCRWGALLVWNYLMGRRASSPA